MRILIVKLSSLGDLFHALPTVRALKAGLPATVDWVTTDIYAELVNCFDDVDRVIAFPRHGTLRRLRPFLLDLRRARYDVVVDLQGLLKSALVTRLARSQKRLGPSFHREGAHLFYTETAAGPLPQDDNLGVRHAVDACLDSLALFDLKPPDLPAFPITFPPFNRNLPRPWIAMAPVSRWPSKNWPSERFAEVAKRLQHQYGGTLFLVGGPLDRPVCQHITDQVSGFCENTAGRLSLVESGGLLQAADVLITNDSGPAHMAAAIGTPSVVMFGPTDPARIGPYGDMHRIIKSTHTCICCKRQRCQYAEHACMLSIRPEHVTEVVDEVLAGRVTGPDAVDRA